MHILITGAAGMIGRKLTQRLVGAGALNGEPIDKLTLLDVVAPTAPAGGACAIETVAADLSAPVTATPAIAPRPQVIFHLAGVVSGEAELDFEKGYRVNLDGMRALLEAIRAIGDGYRPRLVYTSSIAVFGAPFPHSIPDDFHLTPRTSYGAAKAIGELLLADYTRRGFCTGVGIRLPSIVVRLQYAVCAMSESEAKQELQRRLLGQDVFGYTVEDIVAATGKEAAQLNLPDGCVQLLG